MTHRLSAFLVIASLTFLAPRTAAAAVSYTFDTVDAVEIVRPTTTSTPDVIVTGIQAGQTTPSSVTFHVNNADFARDCERLAVIAMSKPGKYQFVLKISASSVDPGGCKLIRRNP